MAPCAARAALCALLLGYASAGTAAPAADARRAEAPKASAHGAPASAPAAAPASAGRQRQLQVEQKELKAKLAQLRKTLAQTESAHSETVDALAASETAISASNRHLQQLAATRHQVQQRIVELQAEQGNAAAAQGQQATRLAQTLRARWLLGADAPLTDTFEPQERQRERETGDYLDAVVRDRARRIAELHDRRVELAAIEEESRQRGAELGQIDAEERRSRTQLLHEQATRKATLTRLAREIAAQRQSVASLERDDARLAGLIDQIGKLLAEQARKRAAAAARARAAQGRPGAAPETVPERGLADHGPPASATRFGQLRGKLVLPVEGQVGSRYGAARLGEDGQPQAGAPAWKGLFLRAQEGTPVHAVAAGQVVYADWLRGFGNILILDHGEGFLSIYANNETLLHSLGDAVAADEVIASVGNTGGNAQSGLYFEMRYQGRPFDPLTWAVARHP